MKPRVAILIPTIGRASLAAALESIKASWDGERVIVLGQRDTAAAERIFDAVDPKVWLDGKPCWEFHALADTDGGFGHDSRNWAIDHLVEDGSYIASLDDDDVLLPGALDAFADAAFEGSPVSVFQTKWGPGHPANGVELYHQPVVVKGNIATPMIFWRKCEARYGHSYFGDYELACALLDVYPANAWAWRDECVCEVRPVAVDEAA